MLYHMQFNLVRPDSYRKKLNGGYTNRLSIHEYKLIFLVSGIQLIKISSLSIIE